MGDVWCICVCLCVCVWGGGGGGVESDGGIDRFWGNS